MFVAIDGSGADYCMRASVRPAARLPDLSRMTGEAPPVATWRQYLIWTMPLEWDTIDSVPHRRGARPVPTRKPVAIRRLARFDTDSRTMPAGVCRRSRAGCRQSDSASFFRPSPEIS